VVNIFGGSSDFKNIIPLAKKNKLKIIEDNAQAIGAKYGNKFLGTIGDIGVFSFNVHKHLQCGEGGLLVTNNRQTAFRAQLVRNHGEVVIDDLSERGLYEPIIGSNYRLTELQAAIAIEQLKKMNRLNQQIIGLANYLTAKLKRFPWLAPAKALGNSTHVYYVYPFRFFEKKLGIKRSTFAKAMAAEGFLLNEGYVKPLYLMPLYQKKRIYLHSQFPFVSQEFPSQVNYKKGLCPATERLYERELLYTTICQPPQARKDIDLFIQALSKIETKIDELIVYERKK
jgi:dTDP-4-amino-4,6-dideoxygalactose transaminase